MTPYDLAQSVYSKEWCARSFQTDLDLHFRNGYVFSGPDFFIMGRPVNRNAPAKEIVNPACCFLEPDAWLIYLAAGPGALSQLLAHEPFILPYFGWERGNVLRFHEREKVIKCLTGSEKRSRPTAIIP